MHSCIYNMVSIAGLSALLIAISGVIADHAELDSALHTQLLLQGRPQVPLYRALLRDAQKQQATIHSCVPISISKVANAHDRSSQQPLVAKDRYEAHCFPQKISHFDSSINGTFCQRYWIDASSYEAGGPIYLLDGGETSGKNR
jgi:hypothetical protein